MEKLFFGNFLNLLPLSTYPSIVLCKGKYFSANTLPLTSTPPSPVISLLLTDVGLLYCICLSEEYNMNKISRRKNNYFCELITRMI